MLKCDCWTDQIWLILWDILRSVNEMAVLFFPLADLAWTPDDL